MKVIVTNKTESVIYNGTIFKCDDIFEVEDTVGKSLIERGYVKATEQEIEQTESQPTEEAEVKTEYLDESDLKEMSYSELRRLATQKGVSANGKKDDLIKRIVSAEAAVDTEEAEDEGDLPNTDMPY